MTKTVCLNRYSNADQCQNISRHWSKNRIFFYRAATESVTNLGKLLTWEIFRAIIKLNHIYAKKQKPHNTDYVVFNLSVSAAQKSELLYLSAAYAPCFHGINPRGVYRGMSEYVGKPHNVLFNRIKRPREKVAEIVRKNLLPFHICAFTKRFHHFPYICPVKRFARFRNENAAACYFLLRRIFFQHFTKLFRNDDNAQLAFHINLCPSVLKRFSADAPKLTHADSRCAYGLHQQKQFPVSL